MTYKVDIDRSALKDLQQLPRRIVLRIGARIRDLQDNPRPSDCKKLTDQDNLYRVRVGDYRMVYAITDEILYVLVVRIAHRKDAYKGI